MRIPAIKRLKALNPRTLKKLAAGFGFRAWGVGEGGLGFVLGTC